MAMEEAIKLITPVSLADYTRPALVLPQLRQHDIAGVIGELSQLLQQQGCVPDLLPFYHSALNQELLSSSAQSCGIAFPHARLSGARELVFALGRTPASVMWGTKTSWPVRLVFLLAVPATDAARYLPLLASLAQLGHRVDLLNELLGAESAESMLAVLERVPLRSLGAKPAVIAGL
jgi:fructose PTS system EIIBC or EIIC component